MSAFGEAQHEYILSEVSSERIEACRYISYVWFNQAKLVFFM